MIKMHYYLPLAAALVCMPFTTRAAEVPSPGKNADAVREPTPAAPGRSASPSAEAPRQPGKASDGVSEIKTDSRFRGKITAMDKDAKTVTVDAEGKGAHVIHIGDDTKLKKGTDSATWNDLTVGMEVQGTCRKLGDKTHAETLTVSH